VLSLKLSTSFTNSGEHLPDLDNIQLLIAILRHAQRD